MKKLLFTIKLKFVSILMSVLQNKVGYSIFTFFYFLYNFPASIVIGISWLINFLMHYRYIKKNYEDINDIRGVAKDFAISQLKYRHHINLSFWLLIIFLLLIK